MPKKRRSLQSIFISSFFHFSSSTPAPVISAPVISAPVISAPVISAPVISKPLPPPPTPSIRRKVSAISISHPSPPRPIHRKPSTINPDPTRSTAPAIFPSIRRKVSAISISHPSPPRPIHRKPSTINQGHPGPISSTAPAILPNHSPPPDYLLDEDPFANLTRPDGTLRNMSSSFTPPGIPQPPYSQPIPRSLLSSSRPDSFSSTDPSMSSSSSTIDLATAREPPLPNRVARTMSGPVNVRPAYLRPAFSHRPSLPSLNSLAQKSVMIPKVRKGKVGARLPSEPWENDLSNGSIVLDNPATATGPEFIGPAPYHPSKRDCDPPDFTHNLDFEMDTDSDVLDLYSDTELEMDSQTQPHSYKRLTEVTGRILMDRLDEHDEHEPATSFLASSPSSPPPLTRSTSSNSSASSRLTSPSGSNWSRSPWSSIDESQTFSLKKISDQIGYLPPLDDDQDSYAETVSPHDSHSEPQWVVSHADWMTSDSPSITPTPLTFSSQDFILPDEPQALCEPSSSAGTIRSPIHKVRTSGSEQRSDNCQTEMVDGGEWNGGSSNGRAGTWNAHTGDSATDGSAGNGDRNENYSGFGNGSGSGHGDDGRGGDRRPTNVRSAFSTPSESECSVEEDEETSTDDYGQDSPDRLNNPPLVSSPAVQASPQDGPGVDDDVPLARRIPTALDAQRSIQKQVREERDKRRRDRALRRLQEQLQLNEPEAKPQTIAPPVVAVDLPGISSSQEAARYASLSPKRPRTSMSTPGTLITSAAIVDLTKRLLRVQDSSTQRSHHEEPLPISSPFSNALAASPWGPDRSVFKNQSATFDVLQEEERDARLRHARSFHKPTRSRRDAFDSVSVRSPSDTNDRKSGDSKSLHGGKPFSFPNDDMLGFDRLIKSRKSGEDDQRSSSVARPGTSGGRPSTGVGRSTTATARPITSGGRPSTSVARSNVGKPGTSGGRPSVSGGRPSLGEEQSPSRTSAELSSGSASQRVVHRPPVPPLRVSEVTPNPTQSNIKVQMTQQRVFIGDMQSFHMVEIGPPTTAGDVLRIVEEQNALKQHGAGMWMLWEMAQDFGMERPIRSFELLSDVSATWNKDKMVNTFLVKKTSLAPVLSRSTIPSSSPKHSGYVEWEVKRGKWNKRWLSLREHCLWLSKRESGKDETMLCSLSTFDAYFVTRPYKSPKPFVFAVKSTDNISFFENTADYLHVFSCSQKDGDKWMEKILLARSYVLQQERTILFARPSTSGAVAGSNQAPLRASTRKAQSGYRAPQPLVQVSAPYNAVPTVPVFEPGSLLAQS